MGLSEVWLVAVVVAGVCKRGGGARGARATADESARTRVRARRTQERNNTEGDTHGTSGLGHVSVSGLRCVVLLWGAARRGVSQSRGEETRMQRASERNRQQGCSPLLTAGACRSRRPGPVPEKRERGGGVCVHVSALSFRAAYVTADPFSEEAASCVSHVDLCSCPLQLSSTAPLRRRR